MIRNENLCCTLTFLAARKIPFHHIHYEDRLGLERAPKQELDHDADGQGKLVKVCKSHILSQDFRLFILQILELWPVMISKRTKKL